MQRAVDAAIGKFAEHTHAGLHLEKLTRARDPNIRTIRIDQFYRGVVLTLGEQRYALLNVLPHDDAIAFAVSRRFTVNQALGVLEMRDQAGIEEFGHHTNGTGRRRAVRQRLHRRAGAAGRGRGSGAAAAADQH